MYWLIVVFKIFVIYIYIRVYIVGNMLWVINVDVFKDVILVNDRLILADAA